MHEFSLIDNIIKICGETAQKHGLARIDSVRLRIGKLRQVVPETMQFAFQIAAEHAWGRIPRLEMEFLPIRMRCKSCGAMFDMQEKRFQCPACGSGALLLIQGRELFIQSIEGE